MNKRRIAYRMRQELERELPDVWEKIADAPAYGARAFSRRSPRRSHAPAWALCAATIALCAGLAWYMQPNSHAPTPLAAPSPSSTAIVYQETPLPSTAATAVPTPALTSAPSPTPAAQAFLTPEEAQALVCARAADAAFTEFELDEDDGRWVYEGECVSGGAKYDFKLDARSGEFYEWELDVD